MPFYVVVTPLRNGSRKPIPPGETVELGKKEGDALVAIGALARSDRQSLEELKATAMAAGVKGYNAFKDPAKLIAAIEKAMAERAEAASTRSGQD
jgi:hypothetical protein